MPDERLTPEARAAMERRALQVLHSAAENEFSRFGSDLVSELSMHVLALAAEVGRLREERDKERIKTERYRRMLWSVVRRVEHVHCDRGIVRWGLVTDICDIGSTSAIALCGEMGVDPHQKTAFPESEEEP